MKYLLIFFVIIIAIVIITIILNKKIYFTDVYKPIDHKKKIIYFGQTIDLENNDISTNYSIGFQLAFQSVNRVGGVNGYKLNIILYNDKYEPSLANINSKILIDYFNVLALIGTFGTPTTVSILNDTIKSRSIPLVGPFTASTVYRKDFNKYLILMNGSFQSEFKLILENIKENNIKNISIIYQNDIYGSSFYNSFVENIIKNKLDINILSTGTYERNSIELDKCYQTLFQVKNPYDYNEISKSDILKNTQSIILFVAEKQISRILGYLKRIKPDIFIYYNFFVGNLESNYNDLSNYNRDNIYQTLLTPVELRQTYPILYQKLLEEIKIYEKNNNVIIRESQTLYQGFYTGLLIIDVLQRFKNFHNLTRENFTNIFYSVQNFNIYGLKIGPFIENKKNVGINVGYLNKVEGNKLKTIKTISI